MKSTPGDLASWSLLLTPLIALVVTFTSATPINRQVGISENVFITVQNDTYGIEQRVCSIDSMTYGDGETIPTSSPCEHCICRPPGFACTIISCEYRPGCKAFKRSNQCCPEYQCECEKDGRIYQNGEKIMDSNNPCEICYCQGGEIVCAVIDCYWRSDCQPRYIENRCCPLYDHCPPPSNSGPFMRPTIPTTTTASGFPWYNLSSAVYEVTERPNPTPVPLFLTSRSTTPEEPSPSTTPKMEPELVVVATEKNPVEINIMATAQEDSQDAENVVASNIVEKEAEATPSEQQPTPIVIVESSPVVPDRPVVVESSPIFTSDSVSLMDSPSTTVFQAPVIAISIVPSPVEQIMVTQEPEILSQIIPEEAIVTSGNNSSVAVEQQPEELATTSVPLVESVEPATATESLPIVSSSGAETETEINPVVSSTEVPVSVVELSESSTVHSPLNIEDPVSSPEPELEITTQIPMSSSSSVASEELIVVNNDAPADEVTTMSVVSEVNTESELSHLDDAVMILADSGPDVTESTTAAVVSQETVTNEPEEINPAPSVVSLIMPTVAENETFDSQVEVTTVSSVASQIVNQEDEIQNDPSVNNNDAPESTTTAFEPIVADEVEYTFKPEVVATESSTLPPVNAQSDQVPISQDMPESIMEDVESIQLTTLPSEVPSVAAEVVPTTSSPAIEPDFPASDDQIANEPEIVAHTTEISSSPSSVSSSQVPEEEAEVTTTAPISTVVNIENQNEEAIIHDAHVVPIELPVSDDSPTIPFTANNEINPIDGETFEIIPPQSNHIENVPEVQNQVMDKQPENNENEVDSQSDRNSDDDTIEIFAAAVNSNPESDNSNVKPEVDFTTLKTIMPMQDDAVVILAADAENEQQVADENEDEIHTDDQHGSSNLDEAESFTTTQQPSMLLHSETEVKQNDDKHSEDVVTTQSSASDDEIPLNDEAEALPETTQVNHAAAAEEEAVHSEGITTIQPSPQNDEPLMEDSPVPTTLSPVNKVVQVVKKTEEKNDDSTQNKFRLDLSAFYDSGEVEGTQSTVTGSPNEVVFDEIPQVPTHPPTQQQLVEEDASKLRNDDEGHNGHAQSNAAETSPTTVLPIVNVDQKENRDDIDEVTTQKSRHGGDEVEPIQNFEFDAIETTSRPNSERSDLMGVHQETVEVIPTTVHPDSENLLRHDAETTMGSNGGVNDFVEVSTGSPSGFGAEYREELVVPTTMSGSNYKSENIAEDSTTVKTSAFDDDSVDPTTHGSENKAKSEPITSKLGEEATTFETMMAVNDDAEEVTTVASTIIINATTTSQPPVPRIVSIDQMIIPKTGVSVPSVSDDIMKPKSDLGRSDIVLEGESDSWLAQTAIKNRQLQGLFPSSRSSQKRLFRSRQPRDAEGSHPFKSKTQIQKTKKVTTNKPVKKPHFPNRSFDTQN